jgi:hypothetical protein
MSFWVESFAATTILSPTCAAATAQTRLEPKGASGTLVQEIEGPPMVIDDPSLAVGTGRED